MAKSISQEQFEKFPSEMKKNYTKEWHCVCNECGEEWNYLANAEDLMKMQMKSNALTGCASCCNPCMLTATNNANTQLSQQLTQLKQCPKCKSNNVKKEARYFPNKG